MVEMMEIQVVVVLLLVDLAILEEDFPSLQEVKVVMMVPYQKVPWVHSWVILEVMVILMVELVPMVMLDQFVIFLVMK